MNETREDLHPGGDVEREEYNTQRIFQLLYGNCFINIYCLNPAGMYIMLGLSNIDHGLIYRLPIPLQLNKIIAVTAVSYARSSNLASRLGLSLVWVLLALTGLRR